jgi:hypothetical protein
MKHVDIFRDPARFAGWPANYGMWSWGNEVVVGFTVGTPQPGAGFHTRSRERPFRNYQARSLDGGHTWQLEDPHFPSPGGRGVSADEHMVNELSLAWAIRHQLAPLPFPCPGGLNFTHPDLAIMCARSGLGTGTEAWFYISYDRAQSWEGPYQFPGFGLPGIEARTDYLVNSAQDCMFFLTASCADGNEGAGVFLARTQDGGKSFALQSWVCNTPEVMSIMPSSVRTSSERILTAVRCAGRGQFFEAPAWIDLYLSEDNGQSFHYLTRPVADTGQGGNPPALTRLADGRLVLTYGLRKAPFGIRARISTDLGLTWGDEICLRTDGGAPDLGYARVVLLADGRLVSAYYYNLEPQGERFIGGTLWTP